MAGPIRGADRLAQAMSVAGTRRVFALSGNQIMSIFDACLEEGIDLLHVRHEAAAVHMADAVGRLTEVPGVALVSAGPGFANTLSALYVALMAESPLILISGAADSRQAGRGAFQEMAQAEMAGHVTKASWTVAVAANLGHEFSRAVRIATSGRPGPVHLAVPTDVLGALVDDDPQGVPETHDFQPAVSLLDQETAATIASQLARAERPILLTGPAGGRGVCAERIASLQSRTGIPAITMESPRGVRDPALGRIADIVSQADVILLLGRKCDFGLRFGGGFSPDARVIQIDPEHDVIQQSMANPELTSRLTLADVADSLPTIERLLADDSLIDSRSSDWPDEVNRLLVVRASTDNTGQQGHAAPAPHPAVVAQVINEFLAQIRDAVSISDGGEFGQWVQAGVQSPRRIINGLSGAIGSAVPFAVAARTCFTGGPIVACTGDGAVGFHIAEFDTAIRYQLPFIVIVGNDACWNAEVQLQRQTYGDDRLVGCTLNPTRYDRVVEAFGGHGEHVTSIDQLRPALDRALASKLPACVNVAIQPVVAPTV